MSNPLDDDIDALSTVKAAFKVVRRVLDQRSNPVSNTDFYGRTTEQSYQMLSRAEEQLEKLVAFSLYATFERTLKDHLASNLSSLETASTIPAELAAALHNFIVEESKSWRMDKVEQMFRPPVTDDDIRDAGQIRTYRHHVAHGASPPTAIPPQTAYRQLTDFLRGSGLI